MKWKIREMFTSTSLLTFTRECVCDMENLSSNISSIMSDGQFIRTLNANELQNSNPFCLLYFSDSDILLPKATVSYEAHYTDGSISSFSYSTTNKQFNNTSIPSSFRYPFYNILKDENNLCYIYFRTTVGVQQYHMLKYNEVTLQCDWITVTTITGITENQSMKWVFQKVFNSQFNTTEISIRPLQNRKKALKVDQTNNNSLYLFDEQECNESAQNKYWMVYNMANLSTSATRDPWFGKLPHITSESSFTTKKNNYKYCLNINSTKDNNKYVEFLSNDPTSYTVSNPLRLPYINSSINKMFLLYYDANKKIQFKNLETNQIVITNALINLQSLAIPNNLLPVQLVSTSSIPLRVKIKTSTNIVISTMYYSFNINDFYLTHAGTNFENEPVYTIHIIVNSQSFYLTKNGNKAVFMRQSSDNDKWRILTLESEISNRKYNILHNETLMFLDIGTIPSSVALNINNNPIGELCNLSDTNTNINDFFQIFRQYNVSETCIVTNAAQSSFRQWCIRNPSLPFGTINSDSVTFSKTCPQTGYCDSTETISGTIEKDCSISGQPCPR